MTQTPEKGMEGINEDNFDLKTSSRNHPDFLNLDLLRWYFLFVILALESWGTAINNYSD